MFRFAFQSCCGGGRGTADKYHWRVWGALAVFWPPWVCPCSMRVCYTADTPGCSPGSGPCAACGSRFRVLHKRADSVGPAFCAFPAQAAQAARSLTGALSPGAVRFLPSAVPASVSTCTSWVPLVSVLGSWSLAATLPVDVNHPESQEVFG